MRFLGTLILGAMLFAVGIFAYDRAVLDCLDRIGFTREFPIEPIWPVTNSSPARAATGA